MSLWRVEGGKLEKVVAGQGLGQNLPDFKTVTQTDSL